MHQSDCLRNTQVGVRGPGDCIGGFAFEMPDKRHPFTAVVGPTGAQVVCMDAHGFTNFVHKHTQNSELHEWAALLAKHHLLRGLPRSHRIRLASTCRADERGFGSVLQHAGAVIDKVHLILEGTVQVSLPAAPAPPASEPAAAAAAVTTASSLNSYDATRLGATGGSLRTQSPLAKRRVRMNPHLMPTPSRAQVPARRTSRRLSSVAYLSSHEVALAGGLSSTEVAAASAGTASGAGGSPRAVHDDGQGGGDGGEDAHSSPPPPHHHHHGDAVTTSARSAVPPRLARPVAVAMIGPGSLVGLTDCILNQRLSSVQAMASCTVKVCAFA